MAKYTVDYLWNGNHVDQMLVCSDDEFDARKALERHRYWHPKWPDALRPNEARLADNG